MTSPYDENGRPRPDHQAPDQQPREGAPQYGAPQQPNGGPGGYGGPAGYGPPSDERSLAAVAHIATLVGMVISVGWLGFVVPLVMWFLYRDTKPFVRQAAAGALNFNVTLFIANAVATVLAVTVVLLPVSILIWAIFGILALVFHIIGTVRATRGEAYDYPLQIRILT